MNFFVNVFFLFSFSFSNFTYLSDSVVEEVGFGIPIIDQKNVNDINCINDFNSRVSNIDVSSFQGVNFERYVHELNNEPTLYEADKIFDFFLSESEQYSNKLRGFLNENKTSISFEENKGIMAFMKKKSWKIKKLDDFEEKIQFKSNNKDKRIAEIILSTIKNTGFLDELDKGVLNDFSKIENIHGLKGLFNNSTSLLSYVGDFSDNPILTMKRDNEVFSFVRKFSQSKDFNSDKKNFLDLLRLVNDLYADSLKINSMLLETKFEKSSLLGGCKIFDKDFMSGVFSLLSQNASRKLDEVLKIRSFGSEITLSEVFSVLKKKNISEDEFSQIESSLKSFLRCTFDYKNEKKILSDDICYKIGNETNKIIENTNFSEKIDYVFNAIFGGIFLNFTDQKAALDNFFKIINLIDKFFSYEKINILPSHLKLSALNSKRVINRINQMINSSGPAAKDLFKKNFIFNINSLPNEEIFYKIKKIAEEKEIFKKWFLSVFSDMATIVIPSSLINSFTSGKGLNPAYCFVRNNNDKKNFISYKGLNRSSIENWIKIDHDGNNQSSIEILTGPNNCGKTLALQAECIALLMAKTFGFVPAEDFSMSRIGLIMYTPKQGVNNKIKMSSWERERQLWLHLGHYMKNYTKNPEIAFRVYSDEPWTTTAPSNAERLLFDDPSFVKLLSRPDLLKISFTTHTSDYVKYFSKYKPYMRTIEVAFNRIKGQICVLDQDKISKKHVDLKGKSFDLERSKKNCLIYVIKKGDGYAFISNEAYEKYKVNHDLNNVVMFSLDNFKEDGDLYHYDKDEGSIWYSELAPISVDPTGSFVLFIKFKLVEDNETGTWYFELDDSYEKSIYKRNDLDVVSNLGKLVPVAENNMPLYMSRNQYVAGRAAMSAKQILNLKDMNPESILLLP